ncbi:MAG: sulfotransferase [Alphaproteobacteria bacterium]|nr:MAG: sulfotransferase [Alphaproteobacteria bacterium]
MADLRDMLPRLVGTVFVVTYGRSGSTLVQSVLQSVEGAHIVGENYQTLFPLFQSVQRARRTRNTWGKRDHPADHPWHGASRVDPSAFADDLVRAFVAHVLVPPQDARWIGFKEIRFNTMQDAFAPYLDFLAARFPNAHFVFNSRDGTSVSKSKWWARRPQDQVIGMVEEMDARFSAYAAAHPDNCVHLRYEDFVSDPGAFRPVFDMLGEPFDEHRVREIFAKPLTH